MRIKLDIPLTLRDIADFAGSKYSLSKNGTAAYICTDSREVRCGDVFIALNGEKYNGEDFVDEALKKGAIPICKKRTATTISVSDTLDALGKIAYNYKQLLPKLKHTVAITGSVGKTTTKEFIDVLCRNTLCTHKTNENENNIIGVPLTVLAARRETELLIVEMGTNRPGEIAKSAEIIDPDIALITNIGTAHIGNFGSRELIAEEKLSILKKTDGILIVPENEPLLYSAGKMHFGINTDCKNSRLCRIGERVYFHCNGKEGSAKFNLTGEHFDRCLCAALAVAEAVGIPIEDVERQIALISNNNIRQKIVFVKNFFILDDSYNASPESVIADLEMLRQYDGYTGKSVLLGSILELGTEASLIHRSLGAKSSEYGLNNLFFFGRYAQDMKKGAVNAGFDPKKIFINDDEQSPEITAKQILQNTKAGEIILFKASHKLGLSNIYKRYIT